MNSHSEISKLETAIDLDIRLFKAIAENDIDGINLISRTIDDFELENEQAKTPLILATEKACMNVQYLPIVKHFLCCGCKPEFPKHLKTKENLFDFFDKQSEASKTQEIILHYFKVAKYFNKVISFCTGNQYRTNMFDSSTHKKNPIKLLLATAQLDPTFFNELVCSVLDKGNEWVLNKSLQDLEDRKHYFICLYNFTEKYQDSSYLTATTLETIADSLISYKKARTSSPQYDFDVFAMTAFFYKMTIKQSEQNDECHERALQKLLNTDIHPNRNRENHYGY